MLPDRVSNPGPLYCIGVGRFLTLGRGGGEGGKVQNIGGPRGGGGKLFAGCNLIGNPASNQCHIISFPTLKTDHTAKLRIELKSIPSNKIKYTYIKLVHL